MGLACVLFRRAKDQDREFLHVMHCETDLWADPTAQHSASFAVDALRYVDRWTPEQGGIIAYVEARQSIGAAWLRQFSATEPGWGFVAEQYPELAIALLPEYTNRGIGSQLLAKLLQHARDLGYPGVSLSVAKANVRAYHTYLKVGFDVVVSDDGADGITMLHTF